MERGRPLCTDAIADRANDDEVVFVQREFRILRTAGIPPDLERGNPDVQAWSRKCIGDHTKTTYHVVKAKPSGWRLYCMVRDPEKREIVFLFAINKKRDDRNPEDFDRCCFLERKLAAGQLALAEVEVAPR